MKLCKGLKEMLNPRFYLPHSREVKLDFKDANLSRREAHAYLKEEARILFNNEYIGKFVKFAKEGDNSFSARARYAIRFSAGLVTGIWNAISTPVKEDYYSEVRKGAIVAHAVRDNKIDMVDYLTRKA